MLGLIVAFDKDQPESDSIRTVSQISTERPCQESECGPSAGGAVAENEKKADPDALQANQQFWEEERTFDRLLDALLGFLRKGTVSNFASFIAEPKPV
jgi:hypothetical protein